MKHDDSNGSDVSQRRSMAGGYGGGEPEQGIAWLGEASRLVFFAAVLAVLLTVAGKQLF